MPRVGYAEVIGAAVGGASNAGWFGDGRDGDLIVEAGQTYVFDVALDEGQVVKQFRNVYIGEGATVKTSGRCNGMVWAVQGDFENRGTITMDKCAPLLNSQEAAAAKERHIALCGLIGGDAGKAGAHHQYESVIDNGGVPGKGFPLGGGYGPGSGSPTMYGGNGEPRPPIGTTIPYRDTNTTSGGRVLYGAGGNIYDYQSPNYVTLYGGNGPGGTGAAVAYYSDQHVNANGNNGGDAIGGGALIIFIGGRAINAGVITASGGNAATGAIAVRSNSRKDASGGGGGAGGGIVAIVHTGDFTNTGTIKASGGKGGAAASSSFGSAGSDGSAGAVLITTLDKLLAS